MTTQTTQTAGRWRVTEATALVKAVLTFDPPPRSVPAAPTATSRR